MTGTVAIIILGITRFKNNTKINQKCHTLVNCCTVSRINSGVIVTRWIPSSTSYKKIGTTARNLYRHSVSMIMINSISPEDCPAWSVRQWELSNNNSNTNNNTNSRVSIMGWAWNLKFRSHGWPRSWNKGSARINLTHTSILWFDCSGIFARISHRRNTAFWRRTTLKYHSFSQCRRTARFSAMAVSRIIKIHFYYEMLRLVE